MPPACAYVLHAQARRLCYGTQAGGLTLRFLAKSYYFCID